MNEIKTGQTQAGLMHDFTKTDTSPFFSMKLVSLLAVVVLLGLGSGFLLAQRGGGVGSVNVGKLTGGASKGTVVGSDDLKTFKDNAEGVLKEGGLEGEGQYHLVRPGGESQYVYLISSIVDLSQFEGKKVKVWGETQKAEKVGWLMDVGRLEVL